MSTATIENNNNNNNNNNVDDVENFANIDEANQQASPTTMTSEEFAKSMEKRFASQLKKFGRNMNHTLKNIGARASTYNDDISLKSALGGVVIRPSDHLTNLSSVGGFVLIGVDCKSSEDAFRDLFALEFPDLDFDEVFDSPFFVASKNGEDKYDLVLHFRMRGGSNDKSVRASIAKFQKDGAIQMAFPNGSKTLSDYRSQRGVAKKRKATGEASTSDSNDENSEHSTDAANNGNVPDTTKLAGHDTDVAPTQSTLDDDAENFVTPDGKRAKKSSESEDC